MFWLLGFLLHKAAGFLLLLGFVSFLLLCGERSCWVFVEVKGGRREWENNAMNWRVCVLFGARTKSLLKVAQNAPFCANLCAHVCDNIATVF